MREITKDLTVELNSGKMITVQVTVKGTYDPHNRFLRNGRRKQGKWNISDVSFEIPDCCDSLSLLSQDDKNQVEKLVSEKIGEERWDFDSK